MHGAAAATGSRELCSVLQPATCAKAANVVGSAGDLLLKQSLFSIALLASLFGGVAIFAQHLHAL